MALIEKEPIMKFIEDGLNNKHYGHVGVEIITEVEFAPTIDAVPVVRCKDCKNYVRRRAELGFRMCSKFDNIMRENDFCSWGEQSGGINNA